MKTIKYIWSLCLALTVSSFMACSDDDNDSQTTPMTIEKVFLQDVKSDVPDREVDFARLGQLIRIQGSGFIGLKKVYINGYDTYFNGALLTDNNLWVTLNAKTPVDKAEADVRNTIVLVKDGTSLEYSFTIRAAAPSVSRVDNTMPKAGETVKVYGSNLQETTKVILPDGTEITSGIESDPEGQWYTFTMPSSFAETGGSLTSEGANGTAVSPAYFNFIDCYIINFDDKGVQGAWGTSTYYPEDLVDDPLNTGRGKVVMLVPDSKLKEGGVNGGVASIPGWWTAGNDEPTDDWNRMTAYIPGTTPLKELALQFDVYVPEPWDLTGQLEITLLNNLSNYGYGSACTKPSSEYTNLAYAWVPWLKEDGSHEAFTTGKRWETITIPLTSFGNYTVEGGDFTLQTLINDRNAGSYRNFGILFCNPDLTFSDAIVYEASLFNQKIYVDNLRIVPSASIEVSDF